MTKTSPAGRPQPLPLTEFRNARGGRQVVVENGEGKPVEVRKDNSPRALGRHSSSQKAIWKSQNRRSHVEFSRSLTQESSMDLSLIRKKAHLPAEWPRINKELKSKTIRCVFKCLEQDAAKKISYTRRQIDEFMIRPSDNDKYTRTPDNNYYEAFAAYRDKARLGIADRDRDDRRMPELLAFHVEREPRFGKDIIFAHRLGSLMPRVIDHFGLEKSFLPRVWAVAQLLHRDLVGFIGGMLMRVIYHGKDAPGTGAERREII